MSKLKWDQEGTRLYETGVDHGVLFTLARTGYEEGCAWNGLSSVSESPSGGEASPVYADNMEYLNLTSAEKFGATIEAYTYPDKWAECDGSAEVAKGVSIGQQTRKKFGLSYRSLIGNDVEETDYGYKIHLIYNGKAAPSERSRQTVNESPEATALSWTVSTTPVDVSAINPKTGRPYKPLSHLTIDSTTVDPAKLAAFEEILYGRDGVYTETVDTEFDSAKAYYELVDGAYVLTSDAAKIDGKAYYEETTAPIKSRLPHPDEVIRFFNEEG